MIRPAPRPGPTRGRALARPSGAGTVGRPRLLDHRLVVTVLAWAVLLSILPSAADAAPLPPGATASPAVDARTLEWRLTAARLVALGVSPAEAAAHVAALSDEERRELAARLDEVSAGGSPAAALAVAIIVGLLVVLVLELLGRRVISRP